MNNVFSLPLQSLFTSIEAVDSSGGSFHLLEISTSLRPLIQPSKSHESPSPASTSIGTHIILSSPTSKRLLATIPSRPKARNTKALSLAALPPVGQQVARMASKEMAYEDLFGYNSFGFPIVLPKMPDKVSLENTNYVDWIQKYVRRNGDHSRVVADSVFKNVVHLKCKRQLETIVKLLAQVDGPHNITCPLIFGAFCTANSVHADAKRSRLPSLV